MLHLLDVPDDCDLPPLGSSRPTPGEAASSSAPSTLSRLRYTLLKTQTLIERVA